MIRSPAHKQASPLPPTPKQALKQALNALAEGKVMVEDKWARPYNMLWEFIEKHA